MGLKSLDALSRERSRSCKAGFLPGVLPFLLFLFLIGTTLTACISRSDDDDSGGNPIDDDAVDDDSLPADDEEDDDDDDDTTPADDDDDTTPTDPYDGFAPIGKKLDDILAISSHMSIWSEYDEAREFEIARLVEAGIGMMRNDFLWNVIEPIDNEWHFDGYDTMVDLCLTSGIQVDALLDYGVDWATPGGSPDEIDPEVWADFNGSVAAHFADRIDVYEIWNEQNSAGFWSPAPNPEHYGNLLKAGYTAIHENDPTATVLFGGLAQGDFVIILQKGPWSFLTDVYEAHPDICDYFDALAIHPYTLSQFTSPELVLDVLFVQYPDLAGVIQAARDRLADMGCPDKPIHLTEMGWPDYSLGTERQGAYAGRSMLLALAAGVEAYYWYTFWDSQGASPPTENTFGLFTWPGDNPTAKPSYNALLGAHQVLGQSQYAGDLGNALNWPSYLHALAFANDAAVWTVGLWHSNPLQSSEVEIVIPLPSDSTGEYTLYDQQGELLSTGTATELWLTLPITGRVHYLQFERVGQ